MTTTFDRILSTGREFFEGTKIGEIGVELGSDHSNYLIIMFNIQKGLFLGLRASFL